MKKYDCKDTDYLGAAYYFVAHFFVFLKSSLYLCRVFPSDSCYAERMGGRILQEKAFITLCSLTV